jgi:hypothetical protein
MVLVIEQLLLTHPLHKLLERCQKCDADLIQSFHISRDENPPDINVPSSCWVLDSQDWAKILKSDSFFGGILMREEYRAATHAVISYYRKASSCFLTHVGDKSMSEDTDTSQVPFPNPFLDLSINETSVRTGFILLGQPGTGE